MFKTIFPYFGFQFTSIKFSVGLTSHDFYRFLIYVHLHPFEVHTNTFGHIQSKKILIFSVDGVMCYYPKCIILQGNCCVKGSNIDISKLESKVEMQHFLS